MKLTRHISVLCAALHVRGYCSTDRKISKKKPRSRICSEKICQCFQRETYKETQTKTKVKIEMCIACVLSFSLGQFRDIQSFMPVLGSMNSTNTVLRRIRLSNECRQCQCYGGESLSQWNKFVGSCRELRGQGPTQSLVEHQHQNWGERPIAINKDRLIPP